MSGILCVGIIFCMDVTGLGINSSLSAQTVSGPLKSTVVGWDDLRPPTNPDFVDPYAHLTSRQLIDLAALSRIEFDTRDGIGDVDTEKGQRLRQKLAEQGLDVDLLLSKVEGVTAHYTQQATDTNPQLDRTSVKLLGYVLPLTQTQDRVVDFLLVPFIGACVHVPPPPPNQLVYVKPDDALDDINLFDQVWLEGTMYPEASSHEFFRVDGEQQVDVSYGIDVASITRYQAPVNPLDAQSFDGIAPGHLSPDSISPDAISPEAGVPPSALLSEYYADYSWWQRIQLQTSTLFTQTMTGIKHQGAWYALPLGVLISFCYGVLHTLGPGHGKAVIVSYFIGKEGSLQRGIAMGIRIAIFHVISAIAIVFLTHLILEQTIGNTAASYRVVRLFSYGAIASIGGWMLWKAVRPSHHQPSGLDRVRDSGRTDALPTVSAQAREQRAATLLYPTLTEQVLSLQTPRTEPTKQPASGVRRGWCSCLTCSDQADSGNWLSMAVGAVPCSGALLVLLYGLGNDLLWPSVLMVLAISLGMAITLSLIGVMAIWGQNRTQQRIRFNFRRQRWWSHWGPIIGASSVSLIGLFMFGFTLATAIADLSS